jgi:hypothetical protein
MTSCISLRICYVVEMLKAAELCTGDSRFESYWMLWYYCSICISKCVCECVASLLRIRRIVHHWKRGEASWTDSPASDTGRRWYRQTRICLMASYSTVAHLVLELPFKGFSFSGLQDVYIYMYIYTHHDFDVKHIFSYSCCSDMWFSYNHKNYKTDSESIKGNI